MRSAEAGRSVSVLINDYLREQLLEDIEDLQAFHERADEPVMSYESLLAKIGNTAKLAQKTALTPIGGEGQISRSVTFAVLPK